MSAGNKKCKSEGKYVGIIAYGNGDYGICALTRIGEVYRDVANSIRDAPIPRRLTEDQREIYKAELDNLALGPEEKGLQAFEAALGKAYELNIYNDCTFDGADELSRSSTRTSSPICSGVSTSGPKGSSPLVFLKTVAPVSPVPEKAAPVETAPAEETETGKSLKTHRGRTGRRRRFPMNIVRTEMASVGRRRDHGGVRERAASAARDPRAGEAERADRRPSG